MKKLAAFLFLATVINAGSLAAGQGKKLVPNRPNAVARGPQKRPEPQAPMLEVIQGLYLSKIQQQTEINEEQYAKLKPLLQDYLRERSDIGGPVRGRAQRQLAQGVNRGASEEELTAFMREFDKIDTDVAGAKLRFLAATDPSLTVRQRARLRIFLVNMENQINQFIRLSQNPNPPPPPRP